MLSACVDQKQNTGQSEHSHKCQAKPYCLVYHGWFQRILGTDSCLINRYQVCPHAHSGRAQSDSSVSRKGTAHMHLGGFKQSNQPQQHKQKHDESAYLIFQQQQSAGVHIGENQMRNRCHCNEQFGHCLDMDVFFQFTHGRHLLPYVRSLRPFRHRRNAPGTYPA